MQDEINEKSINLAVRIGKATAAELKKAIEKLLDDLESGKYSTQNIKNTLTGNKTITAHKAAKQYFESLKLEKLPTIKTLQTEYAALAAEKKNLYAGYHSARKHMQDILAAEQNARQLLNYRETEKTKENERS